MISFFFTRYVVGVDGGVSNLYPSLIIIPKISGDDLKFDVVGH